MCAVRAVNGAAGADIARPEAVMIGSADNATLSSTSDRNTSDPSVISIGASNAVIQPTPTPRVNPIRFMEKVGLAAHFRALDDAHNYHAMVCSPGHNRPLTNDTFERAATWPGFDLHLGSPWLDVEPVSDVRQAKVTTSRGDFTFDFLVLTTGSFALVLADGAGMAVFSRATNADGRCPICRRRMRDAIVWNLA